MATADLDVITAGVPDIDDCPVLRRIKAFITYEGTAGTLQHVLRNRAGQVLDLTQTVVSASVSDSDSEVLSTDAIKLRVKEGIGEINDTTLCLWEVLGTISDAANGEVQAVIPVDVVKRAGIYQLSWGFYREGALVCVNEGLLSMERSLFGTGLEAPAHTSGPPTINEIRMQIMDSDGAENLLLDNVEFNDEQIAIAISKPVMEFNEHPPPLTPHFSTLNFPYKSNWTDAIIGHLLQFAAHNYRRNRLNTRAGGVSIDDKAKEPEYLRASQLMLNRWRDFIKNKKMSLNAGLAMGTVGSTYGARGGF